MCCGLSTSAELLLHRADAGQQRDAHRRASESEAEHAQRLAAGEEHAQCLAASQQREANRRARKNMHSVLLLVSSERQIIEHLSQRIRISSILLLVSSERLIAELQNLMLNE